MSSNTELKTTLEINYDPAIEGAQRTEKTLGDLRGEIKALKDSLDKTAIETDEFKDKLSQLNDKQKELKEVTTLNVSESANLRKQFKQIKDELLGLEEGTEEYNLKLKEAAEISQRLQDVNEFVKSSASDLGDHIENLTGTLAGLTGGIQIVQGTMQALGVESEAVEKAIAKLQGLMAITEGLKAIEGAIDPFKRLTTAIKLATVGMSGFKKALIGTGIGALVVALGALIANWDTIAQKLGIVNKKIDENRKEVDLLTGSYKTYLTTIQSQYSTTTNQMIQLTKDITKIQSILEKSRTSLETRANEGTNLVLEYFGLDSIDTDEVIPKLEEMLKNYYKELDIVNERARQEYNEKEQKKREQEQKEQEEAEKERLKRLQETRKKEMEGRTPLSPTTSGVTVVGPTPELMSRIEADKLQEQMYTKWLKEENQRREENRKEQLENFKQYGTETVLNTMGSIAGILDVVSQSIDTSTEEGFKKSKQMRIATAVIDMLGGILSAWMSAMSLPFPYNFIQAGINTATATAFGSIQIDQIKRQTFNGTSNSNPSVPTISPQMVQTGMNSNSSPLSYLRLNELANQTTKLPDTKVYVTETDIRSTMNKVTVTENESVF